MAEPQHEGETLDHLATTVMLGLIVVHTAQGRATVREVAFVVQRPLSVVHAQLRVLREAGLCDWEEGRGGTLRPTVELVHGPWVTNVLEER